MAIQNAINQTDTGIIAADGSGAFTGRTISATASTGISISNGDGVSGNPTVAGIDATDSVKGVASFASADFGVSSGAVSLADSVVKSAAGDSGSATPSGHVLTIAGGTGLTSAGSGSTVTMNLDSPVTVANGGTGRTSHTAYAVLCGGTGTTTAQQSIASVGTSGQILTSNGAGALPTFQDAASGGLWTEVASSTASSDATIDFSLGSAEIYRCVWFGADPSTDPVSFYFRISDDNGTTFETSNYSYVQMNIVAGSATATVTQSTSTSQIQLCQNTSSTTSNGTIGGEIYILNPSNTTEPTMFYYRVVQENSSGVVNFVTGGGMWDQNADVTDIRFLFSSGNVATGVFRLESRPVA